MHHKMMEWLKWLLTESMMLVLSPWDFHHPVTVGIQYEITKSSFVLRTWQHGMSCCFNSDLMFEMAMV